MLIYGKRMILVLLWCVLCSMCLYAVPVMRISVENTETHVHTIAVQTFAQRLQARTEGRLDVRFYHSASLVRDSEVVRALAMNSIEMAVPGNWQIDSLVPEVSLFLLPAFYGATAEQIYQVLDSQVGKDIVRLIEEDLMVVVPGRWIDLGYAHLFSTDRQITGYADVQGMRIRVAGGYGNEARIAAMGGIPTTIAWPDLPVRLNQQVVGGVLTSFETIRSASLWDYGIQYAFEDNQYFPQYIPMISQRFWNSLTPDLQQIIRETWEEGVEEARLNAAAAQQSAREELLHNGVIITRPQEHELESMREYLRTKQYVIADDLGVPREMVEEAEAVLSGAGR